MSTLQILLFFQAPKGGISFGLLYFVLLAFIIISIINYFSKSNITGHWSHLFQNMQHDPEEFYALVDETLKEQEVPDISVDRRRFSEGGILSHSRIYLEVSRGDYIFHVCAAPWGTGFFFSTWARKKESTGEALARLPLVGGFFAGLGQHDSSSYYKLDTDTMFRTSIHQSVLAAIDRLTEAKGVRGLTELERQPDLRSLIK